MSHRSGPQQAHALEFDPNALGLQKLSGYERIVSASLERVWENVDDWEHLPWLHSESFSDLVLQDAGNWGWRALVTTRGSARADVIELTTEKHRNRYVARAYHQHQQLSEIWTNLTVLSQRSTHIKVSFHLPDSSMTGMPADKLDRLASAYVKSYTQLWDEDEQMMMQRQSQLDQRRPDTNANPLDLGPIEQVLAQLPLKITFAGAPYRVIQLEGKLIAHSSICPHNLGPLEGEVESGCVTCPWHGYVYDLVSGKCTSPAGKSLKLKPPPSIRIDDPSGHVYAQRAANGENDE